MGKVIARPIVETAKEFVPMMKAEGADIIIALAHTGIDREPYHPETENAVYYLSEIQDIDAILAGHSHRDFPGTRLQGFARYKYGRGESQRKASCHGRCFWQQAGNY